MDLIKTGLGIKKTIQNVARLREIVNVFARNGFDELLLKSGIHDKIPNFVIPQSKTRLKTELDDFSDRDWIKSTSYRLRKSFEELGPSFVKLGQFLATREDLFAEVFIEEMKLLQDKVKGIPFEEAKKTIEASLGKPIDSVFSEFSETPIGTASIGVVYTAKLKSGTEVVVKVRRPGIRQIIKTDFDILSFLINQIERVSEEIKLLGLGKLISEFKTSIEGELDFQVEALNNERFKKLVQQYDKEDLFYIPRVYREYLGRDVLVMERIKGTPFSETSKVGEIKDKIGDKLNTSLVVFVKTILKDGFFHADLHGGNFFLMDDMKIGIIDFGLMGALGKRNRANFVAIVFSLINHEYDNVVYEFLDVADYEQLPNVDIVISDVREKISPFIGLTVQQINLSHLFGEIVSTLTKHKLYLPREWFIVFRALATLDGVGKSLKMDFDLYKIMSDEIGEILESFVSKEELMEEGVWLGRDLLSTMKLVPRQLKWFLKDFQKRNYTFHVKNSGYESEFRKLASSLIFLGNCFLSSVLILSGVLVADPESLSHYKTVPIASWVFWGLAITFIVRRRIFRN